MYCDGFQGATVTVVTANIEPAPDCEYDSLKLEVAPSDGSGPTDHVICGNVQNRVLHFAPGTVTLSGQGPHGRGWGLGITL